MMSFHFFLTCIGLIVFFFLVLGIEYRALHILGQYYNH